MPSTFTPNFNIELIASGEQVATWGDTTNSNWGLVDTALGNTYTQAQVNALTWDWSDITSGKPTTLVGYGITDAYTKTEADGKYLLNTTDSLTGNLEITGTLGVGVSADPARALQLFQSGGGTVARYQTGTDANGVFFDFYNQGGTREGYFGFVNATDMHLHNDNATGAIVIDTNNVEIARFTPTGFNVDSISEKTAAAGVTIDGVLIKDGLVDGKDVSTLADAATTLAGYGITDAYTQAQVNALTWDFATDITSKPTTLSGYGITDAYTQAQVNALTWDWSDITSGKPTTISGYGITDAYTKTEADGKYLLNTTDTLVGTLTATTFSGALSGNATTATTATNQSGGTVSATTGVFSGLITGRTCTITTVAAANDAGSISCRGDATYPAVMSFHRAGAYAVNFGLSTANVMELGGWSASTIKHSWDMAGNYTAVGNVTAYSDIRLKDNIEVIPDAIAKVQQLRGVTFDRNDFEPDAETGVMPDTRQAGVIAQEVIEVLPEVVSEMDDGTLTVSYGNMVGLLIEAIKEQQVQIDELKERINDVAG